MTHVRLSLCLSPLARRFRAHRHPGFVRANRLHGQGPNLDTAPVSQPTETSENGFRTLRTRQYGNGSLPLPPMMDPAVLEAKERHHSMKSPQDSHELTDFQKELAGNPYARALATPFRCCSITQVRLPSHFLQAFGTEYRRPSDSLGQAKPLKPRLVNVPDYRFGLVPGGPSSYVLNRSDMIQYLNKKNRWTALVSKRMVEHYAKMVNKQPGRVNAKQDWDLEPEMPDTILMNMRRALVAQIDRLEMLGGDFFVQLGDGVEASQDIHCVIDFDSGAKLEFPKKYRHYNLRELLGGVVLDELPVRLKSAPAWGLVGCGQSAYVERRLERIRAFLELKYIAAT